MLVIEHSLVVNHHYTILYLLYFNINLFVKSIQYQLLYHQNFKFYTKKKQKNSTWNTYLERSLLLTSARHRLSEQTLLHMFPHLRRILLAKVKTVTKARTHVHIRSKCSELQDVSNTRGFIRAVDQSYNGALHVATISPLSTICLEVFSIFLSRRFNRHLAPSI